MHDTHVKIEILVTEVAKRFGIKWQQMFKRSTNHSSKEYEAKKVLCHLIRDNISAIKPYELLGMHYDLFKNMTQERYSRKDYDAVQQAFYSKTIFYKKAV